MNKLIISHGDRVTEHELRDAPLIIGRDPECDLFFADKKLSRHHARIERAGVGFRLVDLGSRNGTWVNEQRVEAREVEPGDEIRIGGLRMSILSEPLENPADQSTVYLGPQATVLPDTGTLALDPAEAARLRGEPTSTGRTDRYSKPPARDADDSSTVFLPPSARVSDDESDETLKRPEPERTVVFAEPPPTPPVFDTGTIVYRGEADSEPTHTATRHHAVPPALDLREGGEGLADESRSEPSLTASVTFVPEPAVSAARSWTLRFSLLAAALGAFSILVLGLPLLRILSTAVVEESELRGQALVDLLAAANEGPLAEGRASDVSIERVVGEPGVTDAFVLSPTGEILAPRDRAGSPLEIEGLSGGAADVRSFRSVEAANGDRVLAQPVFHQGRRVGVAVLSHRSAAASLLAGMVFLLGALLVLMAVVVTVLLAKKMTVNPLNDLRLDLEALEGERATSIPAERPYAELSELVSTFNRVLGSRGDPRMPGGKADSPQPSRSH